MVRCWSQDTLLNGRVFSDERLCPGDRLAIGPIEVEVLDLGGSKSSATAPTGLAPADIAPFSVNRFPCPPRDTQHEIALEPPRPAPRGQSTDPQELADRAVQFDAREADLAIRQRRLDDSYHRWRAKQDAAEAELTRRNEEISSQKEGLASQRALLDEQRRQWEAERSGVQLRLDQQSRRSDARLAELEEQVQALEQERNRWEARQDAADADLARRKEKLAAEQAELANQRAALDEQRRQWEAEQVAVQQQGDQHGQQSDARLAELQEQVRALEQERHQCEADQTAGEADLARRKEELAAEQAELANQRAALDEQRHQWEAERSEKEAEFAERVQRLDAQQAELDAATLPESRRPDPDEPTIAPAGELAPRQESRLEEAPKEASFSSLELLRRLGKMPSFLDEDESPTEHAASDSDRTGADEMPQNPGGAEGRASLPDDGLASSHAGSEEESVDQYMAKLLARMRGEVAATKGREAPSPADRGERGRRNAEREDTRAAAGPAAEAVHTIGAKLQEPVEMSPRAVAPEKSVNLTALREVANLSADNAIDRHARKRLFHIVAKKLTVSLLALLASLALIAAWWLRLAHPLALYAGSVSLIVAILWGLYYPLMSSRMIHGQPQALARKRPRNETPLAPDPSADWYAGPQPPTKDEV